MLRHFPWCWAVWGSEALRAQAGQLSGPVGRMQSRWWASATQKLLFCWFVIWKATQTLPAWQRLSTRQGHCQGFWASNLLLGVRSCLCQTRSTGTGHEPGTQRQGWQHEASSRTEESFRNVLFTRLPDSTKDSARSQGGPGAGLVLTTCPTCLVTRLEPQLWVLGRRGWALESVVARICREAGGRVTTNVMLRDLDMVLA